MTTIITLESGCEADVLKRWDRLLDSEDAAQTLRDGIADAAANYQVTILEEPGVEYPDEDMSADQLVNGVVDEILPQVAALIDEAMKRAVSAS